MNNHDNKPTDHGKPVFSKEEMAEMGQIMGYLRLVITDQATLLEAKVRPYDLSKSLAEAMNKDKAFFEVIEKAMRRYDVMQNPLGEMILKLMDKANGIECNCPNCKPKREAEKMATLPKRGASFSAAPNRCRVEYLAKGAYLCPAFQILLKRPASLPRVGRLH